MRRGHGFVVVGAVGVMGEPRQVRPGVTAAETGAQWWACATASLHLRLRGSLSHADLHDLAGELVTTLQALEGLTSALARHTEAYAERGDLRDDEDADPTARLELGVAEVREVGRLLGTALRPANAFWSAVGHIGLQLDPQHDEHDPEQDQNQQEQRQGDQP